jgi:hypothetical protein
MGPTAGPPGKGPTGEGLAGPVGPMGAGNTRAVVPPMEPVAFAGVDLCDEGENAEGPPVAVGPGVKVGVRVFPPLRSPDVADAFDALV